MPTVLIVDDEQHIRLLIEQTLEELEDDGVDLLTAADGAEAMVVMANQHPDLVFLDVMMPKANGFEVCRAIRADPATAGATVILLTAKGQADDRAEGTRGRGRPIPDQAVRSRRPAATGTRRPLGLAGAGHLARRGRLGGRRVLMEAPELRRLIVRHRHVAPMLSVLLAGTDARVTVTSASGELILDRAGGAGAADLPSERHPIVVEGATVGWVEGPRPSGAIAAVLSYAVLARGGQARARARGA